MDILHRITIEAPAERVFDAVTTRDGLRSWWTADVRAEPKEGSVAEFGFQNHTILFRMKVDRLDAPKLVEWTCLGDVDEWTGTRLAFRLSTPEPGRTRLDFRQAGWRSTDGAYPMCNTDWGRLMYYLKDYVEGRGAGPMMR